MLHSALLSRTAMMSFIHTNYAILTLWPMSRKHHLLDLWIRPVPGAPGSPVGWANLGAGFGADHVPSLKGLRPISSPHPGFRCAPSWARLSRADGAGSSCRHGSDLNHCLISSESLCRNVACTQCYGTPRSGGNNLAQRAAKRNAEYAGQEMSIRLQPAALHQKKGGHMASVLVPISELLFLEAPSRK